MKENTEDIIDSKVKDAWTTEKERAKRARNIIISNFPEPTVQKEQKSEKDREDVEKLLKDHMKLKETDFKIQGNWRIGQENEDNSPRLLKIILDREYMVGTILKATKILQSSTDPTLKNLSIFKDLIKEDRDQRKILVTEMKAKNEALKTQFDPVTGQLVTDRWVIRGDKLAFVDKDFNIKGV